MPLGRWEDKPWPGRSKHRNDTSDDNDGKRLSNVPALSWRPCNATIGWTYLGPHHLPAGHSHNYFYFFFNISYPPCNFIWKTFSFIVDNFFFFHFRRSLTADFSSTIEESVHKYWRDAADYVHLDLGGGKLTPRVWRHSGELLSWRLFVHPRFFFK